RYEHRRTFAADGRLKTQEILSGPFRRCPSHEIGANVAERGDLSAASGTAGQMLIEGPAAFGVQLAVQVGDDCLLALGPITANQPAHDGSLPLLASSRLSTASP